jgi:hypothetical protein
MAKAPVELARDASELLMMLADKKRAFENAECQECNNLGKLGLPRVITITGDDSYIASRFDGNCKAGELVFVCDIGFMEETGKQVGALGDSDFFRATFALAIEAAETGVKTYRLKDAEYVLEADTEGADDYLGGVGTRN